MDALASKVVEFVPFYEIDTPTDPFDQLMRIYIMLTVNIPRLASKGPLQFDVAAEFEKVFGFSLADYTNFMFSLLLHAMVERETRQANADSPESCRALLAEKDDSIRRNDSQGSCNRIVLARCNYAAQGTARVCGFHIPAR